MKYLVYLALIFGSFFSYLKLTNAYAKKVQKGYEPLEREYELSDDEERRQQILEELSKMETKAFRVNHNLRMLYPIIPIIITLLVLVLPVISSIKEYIEILKNISDTYILIEASIGILIAFGFNTYVIYNLGNRHYANIVTGMGEDYNHTRKRFILTKDKINGNNRDIKSRNYCIYPEQFPLLRYNPLAAYNLGALYRKEYEKWKKS